MLSHLRAVMQWRLIFGGMGEAIGPITVTGLIGSSLISPK
jgi:hypothetical protein